METPASVAVALQMLQMVGIVLLVGVFAALFAKKLSIPDIVLYLVVGVVLGPFALSWVVLPTDSAVNQFILTFGAAYILFDGGAVTRLAVLKKVWLTLVILATIGVVITAAITGLAAQYLLGLPLLIAILLGTSIAPTDPATLVPVFKQITVREKVAQTVMSESAFNDATGAIMTFAVLGIVLGAGSFSADAAGAALLDLGKEAGLGLLVGGILGYTAAFLIGHKAYAFLREHMPVVTLILVACAYVVAVMLHGSGFMAVFVAGIMLGNNELFGFHVDAIDEEKLNSYVETTGMIFRMFIFILLGTQVDFALIQQYWLPGLGVVLVFMLVARPMTVFLCSLPDRKAQWTFKERLFMSWTRETGVIPAALAGLLVGMNVPGAKIIASVVFIAILMTIVLQATTTKWLARKLDLLEE